LLLERPFGQLLSGSASGPRLSFGEASRFLLLIDFVKLFAIDPEAAISTPSPKAVDEVLGAPNGGTPGGGR
jgi:hypothetical protein